MIRLVPKTKSFSNKEIAQLFNKMADAYEILGEDRFRISAYQRAAVAIEHSTSELKDLWDDNQLEAIPRVGKTLAGYLDELFKTGKVKHFIQIFKKIPPAIFVFMQLPGIGPKTSQALVENLGISQEKNALTKLKKAALEGKISRIPNLGEKTQDQILASLQKFKKKKSQEQRMLLIEAEELSEKIIGYLKQSPFVLEANPLGSLRRKLATIGDIDISVSTSEPGKVINHFMQFDLIAKVLSQGETSLVRVVLKSGQQIDVRFSKPQNYGSMLQYFTGSKQHNINLREFSLKQSLSLSEYGIKDKNKESITNFKDEKAFYNLLGLDLIPPELREGGEEIQKAKLDKAGKSNLPNLVKLSDIKGDLHVHNNFNIEPSHDLGESSVREMLDQAAILGYDYLGFSEHNPSTSRHTDLQIINLLKRKKEYIEQQFYSYHQNNKDGVNILPKKVFNGLEIDIKPDGSLAIPYKAFDLLDFAIVSVHTSFDLDRQTMTKRVIAGLSHPKAKILGHPTGRMLPNREGFELDWDQIFDFCLKNHKYLEINSWPNRLDLPDLKVKEAVKYGVKMVINSDSHHVNQMPFLKYGVYVAQRGWAEDKDILNTLPLKNFTDLIIS